MRETVFGQRLPQNHRPSWSLSCHVTHNHSLYRRNLLKSTPNLTRVLVRNCSAGAEDTCTLFCLSRVFWVWPSAHPPSNDDWGTDQLNSGGPFSSCIRDPPASEPPSVRGWIPFTAGGSGGRPPAHPQPGGLQPKFH